MPRYDVTQIPANRVPIADENNVVGREWYRFFSNIFTQLGSGNTMATGTFTTADLPPKTVTVVRGVITSIV